MKIDFKKLKEQSWRKTLSQVIISGTTMAGILTFGAMILGSVCLLAHALWQCYSVAPSSFKWTVAVFGIAIAWMQAWNWADKQ